MVMFTCMGTISILANGNDPNSFDEAISCSDNDSWLRAMEEELQSMH